MRWLLIVAALVCTCCGSGTGAPTAPTGGTRIIALEGDMAFGNIRVGDSFESVLRIHNRGVTPLTVTGITLPSGYASSWTSGTIQRESSQAATIRFSPTAAQTYNGTLTVVGNQTSGTNTMPISGTGDREIFRKSGVGDTVFDMPLDVARIHIVGTYTGYGSNFIVKIDNRASLVNVILGTTDVGIGTRYDGTLLTGGGGAVSITKASGVVWSFEEVR